MLDENLQSHLLWITGREPLPEDKNLTEILIWLDDYVARETLPERLHHYLSRRSYIKALEWLEDPGIPHRP